MKIPVDGEIEHMLEQRQFAIHGRSRHLLVPEKFEAFDVGWRDVCQLPFGTEEFLFCDTNRSRSAMSKRTARPTFYKGDSSLPNPSVEGRRRDSEKLSRLAHVYELSWPGSRNLSYH